MKQQYLSITSRYGGGISSLNKSNSNKKHVFIPGVTEVTEDNDDDEEDEGLTIPPNHHGNEDIRKTMPMRKNDLSADLCNHNLAYQSVRHSNLNQTSRFNDQLTFTGGRSKTRFEKNENEKALKEVSLQAEKAEMKVLKYKRLFHQVNTKLQNQSKLYMDQLNKMSNSLDKEQIKHAQTKIEWANKETEIVELNEMIEMLQIKQGALQSKLMSQTELRGFVNKQWAMLQQTHRERIACRTNRSIKTLSDIPELESDQYSTSPVQQKQYM